jgi:universal stress protein A
MTDGFSKIVCPIDFSENCEQSGRRAAWFARIGGGEVHLVHVIGNPADPVYMPEDVSYWALVKHAEQRALALLREMAQRCLPPDCPRQLAVLQGDPYQQLIQMVKSVGADLIVMSTHGRTGLAHLVLGSVAEKIVRHAPCPVFILRRQPAVAGARE